MYHRTEVIYTVFCCASLISKKDRHDLQLYTARVHYKIEVQYSKVYNKAMVTAYTHFNTSSGSSYIGRSVGRTMRDVGTMSSPSSASTVGMRTGTAAAVASVTPHRRIISTHTNKKYLTILYYSIKIKL